MGAALLSRLLPGTRLFVVLLAVLTCLPGSQASALTSAGVLEYDAAGYVYDIEANIAGVDTDASAVRAAGRQGDAKPSVASAWHVYDLSRSVVAPRALPAARQVDATWGPAHQYAHGPGPMTAIEHINYRHAFDSGFDNVSRFAEGTSAGQIQGYVDDALRYGDVSQGGASIRFDVGQVIGTDQAGNAVSGIQIWVRDGYIRTAYPVAP